MHKPRNSFWCIKISLCTITAPLDLMIMTVCTTMNFVVCCVTVCTGNVKSGSDGGTSEPLTGSKVNLVITDHCMPGMRDYELLKKIKVSLKVSIFACGCFVTNYLRNKFWRIEVFYPEACLCVFDCGQVEEARHLVISCNILGSMWPLLGSWFGFEGANYQDISDHFSQFIFSTGGLKSRRSFLHLVWLLSVRILWNE
ncbi:hypothetical protein MTR_4g028380 [Medicago truncatula]|uniref:Uncharacterized protein n=1 Tax=Medicago truncatula TaxID=3880 RepID=G7JID1_MEDTR|nr:hypothetical protein MTR_4g028380 [Medicago truncatula]